MPLTNFPQGLTSFGFPLIGSGPLLALGTVFFVNSATGSDANGYGTDPSRPFATVAYALTKATANHDDTILVAAGHTESITGAAGWTVIAGVQIIGLGRGVKRPTVTFSTSTAAQIVVSGNNTFIDNFVFDLTGIDAVVAAFSITGSGFRLANSRVIISGASNQATNAFTITGDDALFENCYLDASGAAGCASAFLSGGAIKNLQVRGCKIIGDFSVAPFSSTGSNHITEMVLEWNNIVQRNASAKVVINFTTSSTGIIRYNTFVGTTWSTAADAIANSTSTSLRWFQNYGFDDGAGAVSGVLVPAAGTIS